MKERQRGTAHQFTAQMSMVARAGARSTIQVSYVADRVPSTRDLTAAFWVFQQKARIKRLSQEVNLGTLIWETGILATRPNAHSGSPHLKPLPIRVGKLNLKRLV